MNARDVGFHRSLIAAYGHDDRARIRFGPACGTGYQEPHTQRAVMDKEEVRLHRRVRRATAVLHAVRRPKSDDPRECQAPPSACLTTWRRRLTPTIQPPLHPRNAPKLNYGLGVAKYTGSRGKSGASDASAELVARVRNMFDNAGVLWQMAPRRHLPQHARVIRTHRATRATSSADLASDAPLLPRERCVHSATPRPGSSSGASRGSKGCG